MASKSRDFVVTNAVCLILLTSTVSCFPSQQLNCLASQFGDFTRKLEEMECSFPEKAAYTSDPLRGPFFLLKPCCNGTSTQDPESAAFAVELCKHFEQMTLGLCEDVKKNQVDYLSQMGLDGLIAMPTWDACKTADILNRRHDIPSFKFMTTDQQRCDRQCIKNQEFSQICSLFVGSVVKYFEAHQPAAAAGASQSSSSAAQGKDDNGRTGTEGAGASQQLLTVNASEASGSSAQSAQIQSGIPNNSTTSVDAARVQPSTAQENNSTGGSPQAATQGTSAGGPEGRQNISQPGAGTQLASGGQPVTGNLPGQPVDGGNSQPNQSVEGNLASRLMSGAVSQPNQPVGGSPPSQPVGGGSSQSNQPVGGKLPSQPVGVGGSQPYQPAGGNLPSQPIDGGDSQSYQPIKGNPPNQPVVGGLPSQPIGGGGSQPYQPVGGGPPGQPAGYRGSQPNQPAGGNPPAQPLDGGSSQPNQPVGVNQPSQPVGAGDTQPYQPVGGNLPSQQGGDRGSPLTQPDANRENLPGETGGSSTGTPSTQGTDQWDSNRTPLDEEDNYDDKDAGFGGDDFENDWDEKPGNTIGDGQRGTVFTGDKGAQPAGQGASGYSKPKGDQDVIPSDKQVVWKGSSADFDEEPPSGHFMAYFITAVILCVSGYVIYHNKQKIFAFLLEGRREAQRRRAAPASGTAKYSKLQPSVEEVMPALEKTTTSKNYVY